MKYEKSAQIWREIGASRWCNKLNINTLQNPEQRILRHHSLNCQLQSENFSPSRNALYIGVSAQSAVNYTGHPPQ